MNTVNCDKCNQQFTPSLQTTRLVGGAEEAYFICPHCTHRYNVHHISRRGIEIRNQLQAIRYQLRLQIANPALTEQRDALLTDLAGEITDLTRSHPRSL